MSWKGGGGYFCSSWMIISDLISRFVLGLCEVLVFRLFLSFVLDFFFSLFCVYFFLSNFIFNILLLVFFKVVCGVEGFLFFRRIV